ncbi:LicD family protein [Blastococcus sp. HT6-30]|uniref:LicD family protein n=1 Tax=Blastococcus sp. HT6-30 TaxID=3144843 RepID=UPI003219E138
MDGEGLSFDSSAPDLSRVVDLLLDDRRIWSFRVETADPLGEEPDRRRLPWPSPLIPFLDGVAEFALRPVDGGSDIPRTTARLGCGEGSIRFVDPHGAPLMINKWGNLGHALSDYDPGMVTRLLDHVDRVRAILAEHSDLDVYVTGGTLLGPYRDGRVMPQDDDADLAYLSRHSHPADVILEAFQLGRLLAGADITVVRCSAGHLQLHFSHEGRPDGYVDIFTGWIDDLGWWYQVFPVRSRVRRDQLLPIRTIDVEGRPEPMCREPEVMLEAIYGPHWATPDPSFRFRLPTATAQRMYGWLSDQHMDRAVWRNYYRYSTVTASAAKPSDYAQWLAGRLPPGGPVLELGAGQGGDALWLAEQGHRVEAIDYVDSVMTDAQRVAEERGLPARFRVRNLYDPRRALTLGGEIAARREPVTVYARGLLASFVTVGRPNLWRLLAMVLRNGGQAHLDNPQESWAPQYGLGRPLHIEMPLDVLAGEMAPYGLRIDEVHPAEEPHEHTPWSADTRLLPTTRMVISWQRRPR